MENKLILSWHAKEGVHKPKTRAWYWSVGIIASGLCIAAIIVSNYLFALIAIIGSFALMLVGSRPPLKQEYSLYDSEFVIGKEHIPYEKIRRFALTEKDPKMLTLELKNIVGVATISVAETDWRKIRTELKNRNIEEVESIDGFVSKAADWMGL